MRDGRCRLAADFIRLEPSSSSLHPKLTCCFTQPSQVVDLGALMTKCSQEKYFITRRVFWPPIDEIGAYSLAQQKVLDKNILSFPPAMNNQLHLGGVSPRSACS